MPHHGFVRLGPTSVPSSRRSSGSGSFKTKEKGGELSTKEPTNAKKLLRALKKRSEVKRKLFAKEWGLSSTSRIRQKLFSRRELDEAERLKYRISPGKYRITSRNSRCSSDSKLKKANTNDLEDEGAVFKDSNIFLKGTQSANPHNDYSQHFVDTGQRPQNFIRDTGMDERFEEYPKLKELIRLKDEQIRKGSYPPVYLKVDDLAKFELSSLGAKFDVILIEPPLEEYQRRASGITFSWEPWDFEDIMNLKIEEIASPRSFVFIWCGSCEGLDLGRECLKKWGFRRCEDICWVKTNCSNPGNAHHREPKAIMQNSKEHCLMGIKGTVRRNQDGHFIHANIDLDIIITEEPPISNLEKPEEIFHIIEHFCLGRRRLHLFGSDATIRPGWLTVGQNLSSSNFHKETYLSLFEEENGSLLKFDEEIDALRPKTPPLKSRPSGGRGGGGPGGRGGGRGGGGIGRGVTRTF